MSKLLTILPLLALTACGEDEYSTYMRQDFVYDAPTGFV